MALTCMRWADIDSLEERNRDAKLDPFKTFLVNETMSLNRVIRG